MKILLDPGHGGKDPGASFKGLNEKDVVLSICRKTQDYLQYICCIAMTRNEDIYVPIKERAVLANMWNADAFISLHINADPDEDLPGMPEAKGEEIWIYPNSTGGRTLAQYLSNSVDKFFPDEKFRGIKESSHLGVLRLTKMPAILIEVGFIDNSETNESFSDPKTIKRIAQLMAGGVTRYIKRRK